MKRTVMILTVAMIGGGALCASETKLYDIKSGKVEYSIKGSGNMMGMVQTETVGKKRLIFDDYGRRSLTEEVKLTKETTGGQTNKNKTHTLIYMNGAIVYHVDFDNKRITRSQNPALAMGTMMGAGSDMRKAGEAMMKKMGGKKTGTDRVAGVTCDVWELMGTKQCIYKGITLKIESDIMGMKSLETATKASFNISLPDDAFKLPDFPVYEQDLMNPGAMPIELKGKDLAALDEKESQKLTAEIEESSKAIQAGMSAGMAAAAKLGFDPSGQTRMTPEQEAAFAAAMKQAAMAQMGGKEGVFAKTKQEILESAKRLPQIRKCFEEAQNVKEANQCEEMSESEYPEYRTHWNETEKQKVLKELDLFERSLPCIRKADSFEALNRCAP
jgi:hypothetical protein